MWLTTICPFGLAYAVGVARVLSGVGFRQREARATLALLKVLPADVAVDLFEAAVQKPTTAWACWARVALPEVRSWVAAGPKTSPKAEHSRPQ